MNRFATAWRSRLAAPHALWLGPGGLWDMGCLPLRWLAGVRAAPGDAPRHFASFEAWCQAHAGQACALWLSAWGMHELVVDPALPLHGDAGLLDYARPLLQHYHGEAAADWSLAAWQASGHRGVSALHAWPLAGLQLSARSAGVHLRSVRPWWRQALARAVQSEPGLTQADAAMLWVVEGSLVSGLSLARGALVGLQQRRLAEATRPALRALVEVEASPLSCALGHGLAPGAPGPRAGAPGPAPDGLRLLDTLEGDHPAARWWQADQAGSKRS